MISIPAITFDIGSHVDYIKSYKSHKLVHNEYYTTKITNSYKIRKKTDSEYISLKIKTNNTLETHWKPLEIYIQHIHNKCMKSNLLHFKKQEKCRTTNAIVELVDIFPTIADLAEVPIPICPIIDTNYHSNIVSVNQKDIPNTCSEGVTLLPLITNTLKCQVRQYFLDNYTKILYKFLCNFTFAKFQTVSWKKAAFSQYPRPSIQPRLHPNSDKPHLQDINIMGYTLKTSNYRYTAWVRFIHKTCKSDWDIILAEELYDHRTDKTENFNIAASPKMLTIKEYLRSLLKNGWREALPKY